ncbi:MAG: hypothetical protein WCK00_13655 [Deltaproteobacteria bacterium]
MGLAIAKVLGYPATVSVPVILLGFVASNPSGIVAGIYPLFRAKRIYPVETIHS